MTCHTREMSSRVKGVAAENATDNMIADTENQPYPPRGPRAVLLCQDFSTAAGFLFQ